MPEAQIVNRNAADAADHPNKSVCGVVTTGILWQFLKRNGQTRTIQPTEHTLADLLTVLAMLRQIVTGEVSARAGGCSAGYAYDRSGNLTGF
ncbi:MAG: hypothetical protein H8F28_21500 [Fibrella sp.]|nr:hypothetical protein [Armatimonadota bacterium]